MPPKTPLYKRLWRDFIFFARTTFAWFTSSDEVTNRLTASSDYGVSIVESFAPPKNWIPGQEVDKDTYAVNTGSIPAYVRNDVSGVLSLTTEKPVTVTYLTGDDAGKVDATGFTTGSDFASFLTLDEDEVFSKEAGSYLAYKPAASKYELGKQVVIYPSNAATTETVYVCNTDGNYGGTPIAAGTKITKAEYDALNSTEQANFTAYDYVVNAAFSTYSVGDIIEKLTYDALDAGSKANCAVNSYNCDTAVTVNKTAYAVDDEISADVYSTLSAADKAKFDAKEVSTDKTVYVAKQAITIGANSYTPGQQVSAADYATLTSDEDKAKIAVVTQSASKTDFTPDAEGLYVFRRNVIVNNNATEQFEYDGYYFKDGNYYKITDLKVIQDDSLNPNEKKDELDVAGDGNDKDGQLADATANFLVDDTTVYYEPESFTYDAENNRLVATYLTDTRNYNTGGTGLLDYAQALDDAEHNLAVARTALDRALNDEAASDATIAFYANRMAQLQNEIDRVTARRDALGPVGTAGTILANLNAEKTRLEDLVDDAEDAADDALEDMYGTGNATAEYDTTSDDFGKITPDAPTAYDSNIADGASSWNDYLKAKEAVEAARATTAYGHDLFTAYVNELIKIYGPTGSNKISATADYEEVLNKLTYNDLTAADVAFGTVDPELHNINELTAELIKAKADYDEDMANFKSQLAEIKSNTQRIGDAGDTTVVTDTTSADANHEKVGGTAIDYQKSTVTGESGVEGDIARATAEYNDLVEKLAKLNAAYNTAATEAANAEKVNGLDASETATTAWTNYQAASKAYDDALNNYNAAKKAYENGNSLKIYINLSENVVTEAAGLADRWQLLPVSPLVSKYTKDGRVIGEDGVQDDGTPKADTAVFYYTSILDAGETSSKLVDSVTLDSGVTQGMYKAFDYDLNVALKSAQITYTGADNATISTVPANTEFGAKYDKGLSGNVIKGANATLTNDKSLDTAINWAEDSTVD